MVPPYDEFIEPILRYLAAHPEGVRAHLAHEAAAAALGLDDGQRAEVLPSGKQRVFKNRAGWAHDRLKRARLSESPRRGVWRLTELGRVFAAEHPDPLSSDQRVDLARSHNTAQLSSRSHVEVIHHAEDRAIAGELRSSSASPDDRLERALAEIRESVAEELLESIGNSTPDFFEKLVLDLLHAMGYGASRQDLIRVGGSGDGGIDGVISLDRLGLEKVYVQAKRWQGSVGRPDVQSFYGALAGQGATRGVFLTTSHFTRQALDYANSIQGIVLVAGDRLAHLMIEHGVGVQSRRLRVPRIDMDYFDG